MRLITIFLIQTTRSIKYDISKSFRRNIGLDLTVGSLVAVQIYCRVIIRVFLNMRSEKKVRWDHSRC